MIVRNERSYALEIGATGQVVNPGDTAEVPDEVGGALCEQPANWSAVKATKSKNTSEED